MLKTLALPKLSNKSSLKGPAQVRSKKLFPETTTDKIFEKNSTGKVQSLAVKANFDKASKSLKKL